MSSVIQTTFHLTGPKAGQTINLGSLPYPFVKGSLTIRATPEDTALHARALERNWQAYPEGHPALKEQSNGQRDLQAAEKPNSAAAVLSDLQPNGAGAESGVEENNGSGAADPETGKAGGVSHGDGQPPELNQKLLKAVRTLDPTNDEHWTKDGKPAVSAVAHLYGSADVTRKDVDAVAPGFTRDKAKPAESE